MPRRRVHGAAFDEREKRDALKGDVCGDIVEASWKTEQLGDCESHAGFIVHDYISETNDDTLPVMLLISECAEFEPNSIDDFRRGQMWDCLSDRDRILSECKYQISASDKLGGGLPSKERANMLMDYLEALVELYPQCEAVYNLNSGKLIMADDIRKKKITGVDRFIRYAVNARFSIFTVLKTA